MKINVLPKNLANMIAAGEVVERPASVVKELVENSIDAGAKVITAEIQKGGMSYIRITDDGSGIEPGEVETAFARHATSKISVKEDLDAIYTLGFRGEALASIAAVSRIDIFTKTRTNDFAKQVKIEGGEITESGEAGAPDGTTIVVRDLFYNTPARMKFLKSDSSEAAAVTDVITKMALGHPEVKLKLISNSKTVFSSTGDADLKGAIYSVWGKDIQKNVIQVKYESDNITITGYVGNASIARKDRRGQVFFINSRHIQSPLISSALTEAFQNEIMVGKHPFAVLNIEVNAGFVDVNVHPTKMQVRFSDDKKVYSAVYWAVKNALSATRYVPEIEADTKKESANAYIKAVKSKIANEAVQTSINLLKDEIYKTDAETQVKKPEEKPVRTAPDTKKTSDTDTIDEHIRSGTFFDLPNVGKLSTTEPIPREVYLAKTPEEAQRAKKDAERAKLEYARQEEKAKFGLYYKAGQDFAIVGQAFATYIIIQKGEKLIIIDQHAAQERIFYEELLDDFENRQLSSQLLLLPRTVKLSPEEYEAVCHNAQFLSSMGFECDTFGDTDFVIRAVPSSVFESDIEDLFISIADLLAKGSQRTKASLVMESLYNIACKKAIKANKILTREEMESLAQKVLSLGSINTCPHGRPICISMTRQEMEKLFKRIV